MTDGRFEFNVAKDNLYREETVTDMKSASIKKLIPIKVDGSADDSRKAIYVGMTNLMSPAGPVPINVPIEAESLEEAIDKMPQVMQDAINELIAEAEEMQRQQASQIIVPGSDSGSRIIH